MKTEKLEIDIYKKSEGVHYELIPLEEDSQAWAIRIIEGPFSETVIKYGRTEFDGTGDDTIMKFSFEIISSPDEDLNVKTNTELQQWAGDILQDLIAIGIGTGATVFREKEKPKYYLKDPK